MCVCMCVFGVCVGGRGGGERTESQGNNRVRDLSLCWSTFTITQHSLKHHRRIHSTLTHSTNTFFDISLDTNNHQHEIYALHFNSLLENNIQKNHTSINLDTYNRNSTADNYMVPYMKSQNKYKINVSALYSTIAVIYCLVFHFKPKHKNVLVRRSNIFT